MIKLTERYNKFEIWVNPALIQTMTLNYHGDGTNIMFVNETAENCLCVNESPTQIITLIEQLKYA